MASESIATLHGGRLTSKARQIVLERGEELRITLPPRYSVPRNPEVQRAFFEALHNVRVGIFLKKTSLEQRQALKKGAWCGSQMAILDLSFGKVAQRLNVSRLEIYLFVHGLFPEKFREGFVERLEEVLSPQI